MYKYKYNKKKLGVRTGDWRQQWPEFISGEPLTLQHPLGAT